MRKTEAALSKIAIEILEEMYDHATPPAKYPSGVDSYEDHFLSAEQQGIPRSASLPKSIKARMVVSSTSTPQFPSTARRSVIH